MKKRHVFVVSALVYMLLLWILTVMESACPGATIDSIGDALWYSITTVTTVGYGDLYPVSLAGRMIGVLFMLLGVGFLAFAVGTAISLLTGRLFPQAALRRAADREWFVYSQPGSEAAALAERLEAEYPGSVQIFCRTDAQQAAQYGLQAGAQRVLITQSAKEVLSLGAARGGERSVFLIGSDPIANCSEAAQLQDTHARLYCMSGENAALAGASFFDPCSCCARLYWQRHPLGLQERRVLIIGSGCYAQEMIRSALLINCRAPFLHTSYHLFGDWENFLHTHHQLAKAVALNCEEPQRDAVTVHPNSWRADWQLLETADRIIFCMDDEDENAALALELERYFVTGARVYARTGAGAVPAVCFGGIRDMYTPELVMRRTLDRRAAQMHELYRRGVDFPAAPWEELGAFARASNRAAADHLSVKARLLTGRDDLPEGEALRLAAKLYRQCTMQEKERLRRCEHDRWMRFHLLHNWRYAPERDNAKRLHPSLIEYDQLSEQERAKDDYAWEQLVLLSEEDE